MTQADFLVGIRFYFNQKMDLCFYFTKLVQVPREWWGLYLTSTDNGKHWSEPVLLPKEIYGPIKNKPVQLENGLIFSTYKHEHDGWKIQIEKSSDFGQNLEHFRRSETTGKNLAQFNQRF